MTILFPILSIFPKKRKRKRFKNKLGNSINNINEHLIIKKNSNTISNSTKSAFTKKKQSTRLARYNRRSIKQKIKKINFRKKSCSNKNIQQNEENTREKVKKKKS